MVWLRFGIWWYLVPRIHSLFVAKSLCRKYGQHIDRNQVINKLVPLTWCGDETAGKQYNAFAEMKSCKQAMLFCVTRLSVQGSWERIKI